MRMIIVSSIVLLMAGIAFGGSTTAPAASACADTFHFQMDDSCRFQLWTMTAKRHIAGTDTVYGWAMTLNTAPGTSEEQLRNFGFKQIQLVSNAADEQVWSLTWPEGKAICPHPIFIRGHAEATTVGLERK